MKVDVDRGRGVAYIMLRPGEEHERGIVIQTIRVTRTVNVDLDKDGRIVGIELLDLTGLDV